MNDTINRYLSILCYPFASLDFFLEDYFEEIIRGEDVEEKLQEATIRHIQKSSNVYSYDEVYMYLDKCYLHELRMKRWRIASQLYLDCMYKIVHSLISQRDGKIAFKYWKNNQDEDFLGGFGDPNKIFLFHSMNMHMPLDFIVMLYMAQNKDNDISSLDNYYNQIEVADQQLDAILKAGVAENHLHKGVSVSFFEIWEALMMPLNSFSINEIENGMLELSDRNLKEGEILFFLLTAAIVRVWIALAVQKQNQNLSWPDNELNTIVRYFGSGLALKEFYGKQWGDVEEKDVKHEILLYCQKQWEKVLQILPEQREERTIMQEIFRTPVGIHTSDETIFLFYGMKYLNEKGVYRSAQSDEEDPVVRCILQYLRVKNYMFGCTVQKKNIRGLDYFEREYYQKDSKLNKFYSKLSGGHLRRESKTAYWEQAMRKQFHNRVLKKIEFRTSIDENETAFRGDVRAFLEAYRNVIREDYCIKEDGRYKVYRSFPRAGLIFHLIKKKDMTVPNKCYIDGLDEKEKMQFGVLEKEYEEQIDIMCRLRKEIPGLDRYLVGIDAASLENSTPVWVFTKAYNKARDSVIEKIGYDGTGTQSLRFTFHAGEDFRHILSGLRRMDEAVSFLKFHAGDRIGHGTALGLSPDQWRRYNPFVVLPRIEALENYIWAHYMLSQDTMGSTFTLTDYIERRVYELAKGIYGKSQSISLQALTEGYLKMFDTMPADYDRCREANYIGFCKKVQEKACEEIVWNGEKIAMARHCKKFLSEMERPIHYEVTEQDIQITETLQKILRQKLSRKGIIVEVNPSSNVAIGEVDKITDHQIYQLNRPGGEINVMVCINSDDPTVFHTNVSNELAYIYYGMLYNGVSREIALEWIDKVRECGIKSSFLQGEDTDQQVYDRLEKLVEAL